MKRDMDLIREILIGLSEAQGSLDASVFVNRWRSYELVAYHFEIMGEAGIIVSEITDTYESRYYNAVAYRLTWEGHELLAAISSPTVWDKVNRAIAKIAEDVPLSMYRDASYNVLGERVDACMGTKKPRQS